VEFVNGAAFIIDDFLSKEGLVQESNGSILFSLLSMVTRLLESKLAAVNPLEKKTDPGSMVCVDPKDAGESGLLFDGSCELLAISFADLPPSSADAKGGSMVCDCGCCKHKLLRDVSFFELICSECCGGLEVFAAETESCIKPLPMAVFDE